MRLVTGFALSAGLALGLVGAAQAQDDGNFAYVGTSLFGENEVGHEGAGKQASGDFTAELDLSNGRLCYLLEVAGLDDFAAAHVHEGDAGKNGPPVATLQLAGDDGEDVCMDVDAELLRKIAKNPARYYVNVHTAALPEGAVRGQLGE